MADRRSLLPSSATPLMRALDESAARIEEVDAPIETLWDPRRCPAEFLPWLAWSVGVLDWDHDWPEETKRDVVAATPEIRRRMGTVWAVRQALIAAGYADAELEEGLPTLRHDGSENRNGQDDYAGGARWALFRLVADIGEDRGVGGDELERLIRLVRRTKPARSQLREIAYRSTVADELDLDDQHQIRVKRPLDDVRPAGVRHDGSIDRNQATREPKEPTYHDRTYQRDGYLAYDGLTPHYTWDVHGHRRDNVWDRLTTALGVHPDDDWQVESERDGRAAREGAMTHGGDQPPAVDAGVIRRTERRRHNGRLTHDGTRRHLATATTTHRI